MDIYEMAQNVNNQEEFLLFLKTLLKELEENPTEWENTNLKTFLTGIEGYCYDRKYEKLSWNVLSEILLAARVYE